MSKKYFYTLFLLFAASVLQMQAQTLVTEHDTQKKEVATTLKSYNDSLLQIREKIFNSGKSVSGKKRKISVEEARLFLPIAYYKDVIHNIFSLDSNDRDDMRLAQIYLQKPYLVQTTERLLRQQQEKRIEVSRPLVHKVEVADKVVPAPVEMAKTPVELLVLKPDFWSYKGDYSLQVLQNYVSDNWYKGGESNYSALAAAVMEANYNNKQKVKWDNRLELKFGLQSSRSDSLHKVKTTEDLLRLTSKFGLQASKKWYYTVQFIGYTQFARSYKSNDPKVYSAFLAPFNLNLSLGMNYTMDWMDHKLKGNINIAPLAYNLKYTRMRELAPQLGIEEGRKVLHNFGSQLTVDFEWQLMEMLKWKSRLYGYTTFERAEIEWENTFTLQFNKYIGAQLFLYPRFDDGVVRDGNRGYWQIKEFASIGFQLSLATNK